MLYDCVIAFVGILIGIIFLYARLQAKSDAKPRQPSIKFVNKCYNNGVMLA
jgi:hypothetical protein